MVLSPAPTLAALFVLAFLLCATPARAAPWVDMGEDAIEERIAEGDLDE